MEEQEEQQVGLQNYRDKSGTQILCQLIYLPPLFLGAFFPFYFFFNFFFGSLLSFLCAQKPN